MILLYLAAAWVAGIALAAILALPTSIWLWLLVFPAGCLVIWHRDPNLRRVHFIFLVVVLGALRFQIALPSADALALAQFNDRGRASLIGVVVDEPDRRDAYTGLSVEVTKIQRVGEWQTAHGRALVQAPRDTPARYGDEIQIDGEPSTPPDGADFSYRDFLARASTFTLVSRASVYVISHDRGNPLQSRLYAFKTAAFDAIARLVPEPSASLLQGILLGNAQGIPRALSDAFARTNTSHVIAISGFNIGVLALYLGLVFKRIFKPAFAAGAIILSLVLYTLLVGAGASVIRATIMGGLTILAVQNGRQTTAQISLAAAAIFMTLLNPYALWDVGFQLSFLATFGLVLYVKPLTAWVEGILGRFVSNAGAKNLVGFLGDSFIVTLAAQVTTAPLIVATFHRLSLIGLLTNFLILPVQPPLMILGGLATLVQLLAEFLAPLAILATIVGAVAQVLAWGAYVFLQYTILIVEWTAQVPFGSFETPRIDWALVFVAYAILFAATYLSPRRLLSALLTRPVWAAGLLAFVTLFVWTGALAAPDPRTHIQFLATSGGDAIFIRSANGARLLIDGSTEPSALLAKLGQQMPFWDQRLDLMVATNVDEPNLASLNAVLERFTVGQVLEPPSTDSTGASYKKWRSLLESHAVPSTLARAGTHLQVDELTLDVLYPPSDDSSTNVALRLAVGSHVFLLAPALHAQDLRALQASEAGLSSEFAVLPAAFDQDLLKRASPHTVIFFVGKSSREQPALETLKLLNGVEVLRTDENGDIEVIVEGDRMEIKSDR